MQAVRGITLDIAGLFISTGSSKQIPPLLLILTADCIFGELSKLAFPTTIKPNLRSGSKV